jgi:hypothetical protein
VFFFCIVLLLLLPDRGNVITKVVKRKKKSCLNYRKFQISELSLYLEKCAKQKFWSDHILLPVLSPNLLKIYGSDSDD